MRTKQKWKSQHYPHCSSTYSLPHRYSTTTNDSVNESIYKPSKKTLLLTFISKPATAITNPYPTSTIPLPRQTTESDTGDYESELAVVIGRSCKNVSEADALNYVAGYTAANDISCRAAQFAQSQWCYSKSFDGACPIGIFSLPLLLSLSLPSRDIATNSPPRQAQPSSHQL